MSPKIPDSPGGPTAESSRPELLQRIAELEARLTTYETGKADASLARALAERKRTEEALRESEARLRCFIEDAPAAIAMFDRDMRYVAVSRRWRMEYLNGAESVLGGQHYELLPDCPERWKDAHRKGMAGEIVRVEEDLWVLPDGSELWARYEVRPWRAASGGVGGIIIFTEDISERKRTEQARTADLAALTQIHSLSTSTLETADLEPLLQRVMDAAVNIMRADRGTLKLMEGDSLLIVAHHGHQPPYLNFFNSAAGRVSAGEAMKRGERVIIEDVEANPMFAGTPMLAVLRAAGVRAINSTPLRNRNGVLLGILTTQWSVPHSPAEHDLWRFDLLVRQAADLIEHNRSQAALRRIAELPAQSPDVVMRVMTGGELDYANPAARSCLLGMGAVVEGQPLQGPIRALFERVGAEGGAIEDEVNDEQGRTYLFTAVQPSGESYVNLYGRDITDRKRTEEALRQSEEMLRFAQDAAAIGAFEWNIQTGVNTCTPKLEQLYGLPAGAFAQTQPAWENLIHPEDRAGVVDVVKRAFETGSPTEGEWRVVWPDGSVHWLNGRWHIFRDSDGTPVRMTGINIDITDRKLAEQRILQAQKLESIARLAGGLAHDYNNLMSVILLEVDSALAELSSQDSAVGSVTAIRDAAGKAVALGQQLMAFGSKQMLQRDTEILQPEALDLNSFMGDAMRLVQSLVGDDVTITFHPDSRLGLVRADRGQLLQLIMNLALNSRDAMPQGGTFVMETENVEFDASDARLNPGAIPGPYVMLRVWDTGVGMDKATRARIFEPFFTTKEIGRGTGLGLSVVYGIVRQSGGFITVSSEPGQGTEFNIYLPASLEAPGPILQREQKPPVRGGSETILLVEDEPALRQKICEVMENAGYRILVARDGNEGFRLAEEHARQIHLLVTDVVMPNMSGPRLSERLRAPCPEIKTLYMSGYPDMGEGSEALRSQPNFIQKPFTQEELMRRVREVLDSGTPQE